MRTEKMMDRQVISTPPNSPTVISQNINNINDNIIKKGTLHKIVQIENYRIFLVVFYLHNMMKSSYINTHTPMYIDKHQSHLECLANVLISYD